MAHSYSSAKILSDPFSPTIAVCPGRVASKPVGLPSGNQMWQWEIHYKWRFQMGKSSIEWGIFHCHLWFPEAIHGFCTQIAWFLPNFSEWRSRFCRGFFSQLWTREFPRRFSIKSVTSISGLLMKSEWKCSHINPQLFFAVVKSSFWNIFHWHTILVKSSVFDEIPIFLGEISHWNLV